MSEPMTKTALTDTYCATMEEVVDELRRRREARKPGDLVITRYEKARYGSGFRVYSVPAELLVEQMMNPSPRTRKRRLFAGE